MKNATSRMKNVTIYYCISDEFRREELRRTGVLPTTLQSATIRRGDPLWDEAVDRAGFWASYGAYVCVGFGSLTLDGTGQWFASFVDMRYAGYMTAEELLAAV